MLNFTTLEISLIVFFIGLFTGFIATFIALKIMINRRIKNVYNTLNHLLLFKIKHQKDLRKRSDNLFSIDGKLKILQKELSKLNTNGYTNYLDDLNQILLEKGISKVSGKK